MAEHHYHVWLLDVDARHGRLVGGSHGTRHNARYHAQKLLTAYPAADVHVIRCKLPDCAPPPTRPRRT